MNLPLLLKSLPLLLMNPLRSLKIQPPLLMNLLRSLKIQPL